jgi:hypothetical protein
MLISNWLVASYIEVAHFLKRVLRAMQLHGDSLLVLQGKITIFKESYLGHVQELLQIVGAGQGGDLLERQLLCSRTSQLMARVLQGMILAAAQVRYTCHALFGYIVVASMCAPSLRIPSTPDCAAMFFMHMIRMIGMHCTSHFDQLSTKYIIMTRPATWTADSTCHCSGLLCTEAPQTQNPTVTPCRYKPPLIHTHLPPFSAGPLAPCHTTLMSCQHQHVALLTPQLCGPRASGVPCKVPSHDVTIYLAVPAVAKLLPKVAACTLRYVTPLAT